MTDIHAGPLDRAAPDSEHSPGPLEPTPPAERAKKGWREQRWERRRRRRMVEEVVGWIIVPLIVIAGYWGVKSGLSAMGTTPSALIQGIKTAISNRP